ncbi:hypothetical protein PVAND_000874 [Polypedilum vanderplanki]|uniref:BTB domain-containing protein n=1 Tax=Polypedilum vanderplanki TaxID=319348 RepID=A0A9J6BLI0_POLVA|nr:hypothetical protein PVAND_000874 [Polypedilum vanderplanki]
MSQKIQCEFRIKWKFRKNHYSCDINNQMFNENEKIEIYGKHLEGKSNEDVNAITLMNCKLSKFPRGLKIIFPYLQSIHIFKSNLSKLSKEDLKEFKTLKQLYLEDNEILFLQENLFSDMKSLEILSVHEQNLLVIEPNIFNNLENIKCIDFRQCNLVNFVYNSDGSGDCKTLEEVKIKLQEIPQVFALKLLFDKLQELERDSKFLKELKTAMNKENFKDFNVIVDKEQFHAHKLVLAARSPVFAEMIENNSDLESLNLVDISPDIFREVYNFMYTNEFPNPENVNLVHLLIASEKLKIKNLADFAANTLLNKIIDENAFELLTLGRKYDYKELQEKSFKKIKEFFDGEHIDEGLINKPETLKKLIDLKREKIRYLAELEQKFKSIMKEN